MTAKPRTTGPVGIARAVLRRSLWLAYAVVLVGFVLYLGVHLHLWPESYHIFPQEQMPALGLVAALVFVLQERIAEWREDAHQQGGQVREALRRALDEVQSLKAYFGQQRTLEECVEIVQRELDAAQPPYVPVHVDHIGLDMTIAWNKFRETLLEKYGSHRPIVYRLLMVTSDPAQFMSMTPKHERVLRPMCASARDTLEDIKQVLADAGGALGALDFEVRMYRELPVVHGFRVRLPRQLHFVCFFRWRGASYDEYFWGDGRYNMIGHAPPRSSAEDLAQIFDSYFEHLWRTSERVHHSRPDTGAGSRVSPGRRA